MQNSMHALDTAQAVLFLTAEGSRGEGGMDSVLSLPLRFPQTPFSFGHPKGPTSHRSFK